MKNIIAIFASFLLTLNAFCQNDSLNQTRIGTQYLPFKIISLDGKLIDNEALKGKVTLFSFWFEGCQPCLGEIPFINAIYDKYKSNTSFQLIGVTFDKKETLSEFVKEHNMHYPVMTTESSDYSSNMNFRNGYPFNILIDKNGKIVMIGRRIGKKSEMIRSFRNISIEELENKIQSLL